MSAFSAGSIPWLLRHELRIALRGFSGKRAAGATGPAVNWRLVILGLLVLVVGGAAGLPIARLVHRAHVAPSPYIFLGVAVGSGVIWTLMLAQTLTLSTQVLYERNDLDLLLSSPIPPRRVLTVRALGIAVLAGAFYGGLASLFVLPMLVYGEARWLGLYVVIAALALTATAVGLLAAMGLFALLGPRRTRVVAQVLAAAVGALVFLVAQARNFLPRSTLMQVYAWVQGLGRVKLDPHAAWALPGRAAMGDVPAVIAVLAIGVGLFAAVARLLGRRFGTDAAAAAGAVGDSPVTAAKRAGQASAHVSFAGGPFRSLVRKELRLLVRDPWLISQMLLQMVYILPMGFVIARNAHGLAIYGLASGGSAASFLCGQLAGNLTWVTVSAEEAPELVACAPVTAGEAMRAKLAVALTPVAVLALIPVLTVAAFSPLAGLIAALGCAASGLTSAALNIWWSKPGQRRDFRRRRSGSGLIGLVELFGLFAWAGAVWLAITGNPWAALPAAAAVVLVAAMRRPVKFTAEG